MPGKVCRGRDVGSGRHEWSGVLGSLASAGRRATRWCRPQTGPRCPCEVRMARSVVLEPGLIVHGISNGYWFWGRPSVDDLWRDLRAATADIGRDWDLSVAGLRDPWAAGTGRPSTSGTRRSGGLPRVNAHGELTVAIDRASAECPPMEAWSPGRAGPASPHPRTPQGTEMPRRPPRCLRHSSTIVLIAMAKLSHSFLAT
jgi:hypothetical protein